METTITQLYQALRQGVTPALTTPLNAAGDTVHTAAVPPLVDFLLARGVKGLFVGGTTGEGIMLTLPERQRLHEAVVEAVAGRVPVLLHVGTNQTAASLTLIDHAVTLGVAALVALPPYFISVPDEALFDYFQRLAERAAPLPFLVYDIPHLAVNGISPALLERLCGLPNFAGLKCSRPEMQAIRRLVDVLPEGKFLLAGNERVALGSLALGAAGLITGLSTAVPEPFVALTAAFGAGQHTQALAIQKRINRALDVIPAGERLGVIKQILQARDVPVGPPVPPRPWPQADHWPAMAKFLLDG